MENQYIIFRVQENLYGLPINFIKEVVQFQELTPLPFSEAYLRGIFNLRSLALAVIDLSVIFFGKKTKPTKTTAIMVAQFEKNHEKFVLGLLVDQVIEVLATTPKEIQKIPEAKENLNRDIYYGLVEKEGKFIALLKITEILTAKEIKKIVNYTKEKKPINSL